MTTEPRDDPGPPTGAFLASLTDTSLYSIGAYFADRHPDLIEDVPETVGVNLDLAQGIEVGGDRVVGGVWAWAEERRARGLVGDVERSGPSTRGEGRVDHADVRAARRLVLRHELLVRRCFRLEQVEGRDLLHRPEVWQHPVCGADIGRDEPRGAEDLFQTLRGV